MIRNPILKVLSSFSGNRVKALLMGGQACVVYGASEFSRDSDFAVLAKPENLAKLEKTLSDLDAKVIAVPSFDQRHLARGHAIHFRCQHPDAYGMRIDIMSVMRGVDSFDALWSRRTTFVYEDIDFNVMGLRDLVKAKKTQRDKDWPMIRRLLEADIMNDQQPNPDKIFFWLEETRSPELLINLCKTYPEAAQAMACRRTAVSAALAENEERVLHSLEQEEKEERQRDREYWLPLRKELEAMRHRS